MLHNLCKRLRVTGRHFVQFEWAFKPFHSVSFAFSPSLCFNTQVDSKAKPPFPRQTSVWWFDCKSAQNTPTRGGLSSELRTPIFVANNGAPANNDASASGELEVASSEYQSTFLEVDKDVDYVRDPSSAPPSENETGHNQDHNHDHQAERASLSGASLSCKSAFALTLFALCVSLPNSLLSFTFHNLLARTYGE